MVTLDTRTEGKQARRSEWLKANRVRVAVLVSLLVIFLAALGGLDTEDWFATIMQGLSAGAITFLVASGLSLIFGLMDVLNLAHGELFMLGAYVGWTVYVRFDTALDIAVPLLVLAAPFALLPIWRRLGLAWSGVGIGHRVANWATMLGGIALAIYGVTQFPLVIWDAEQFTIAPASFSLALDIGTLAPLPAASFDGAAIVAVVAVLMGGAAIALAFSMIRPETGDSRSARYQTLGSIRWCPGRRARDLRFQGIHQRLGVRTVDDMAVLPRDGRRRIDRGRRRCADRSGADSAALRQTHLSAHDHARCWLHPHRGGSRGVGAYRLQHAAAGCVQRRRRGVSGGGPRWALLGMRHDGGIRRPDPDLQRSVHRPRRHHRAHRRHDAAAPDPSRHDHPRRRSGRRDGGGARDQRATRVHARVRSRFGACRPRRGARRSVDRPQRHDGCGLAALRARSPSPSVV